MDISVLEALLAAEQYVACENMAIRLLQQPNLKPETKAQANLLLCRSRIGQAHYTAAIEPGHVAVFIARDNQLFDTLGQALRDVGYACYYAGLYQESAQRYRTFFDYQHNFSADLQGVIPHVWFSLGTALRALRGSLCEGENEAAVCFQNAWEIFKAAGDEHWANEARSNLVWECFTTGDLQRAAELITEGSDYVARHPEQIEARVHHLVDLGKYHFLTNDHEAASHAASEAIQAAKQSGRLTYLEADAKLLLGRTRLTMGDVIPAFIATLNAKWDADAVRRKDIMADADTLLDEIISYHEDIVLAFVRSNTGRLRTKGDA